MPVKFVTSVVAFFFSVSLLHAQALPTATRALQLQAGATVSLVTLDYGDGYEKGYSAFAAADLGRYLGAEAVFHDANIITPYDIGEDSFLVGPRFHITRRRFTPYAKLLFGYGTLKFAKGYYAQNSSESYFIYAYGGGLDFRATRHISVRAIDIEYQEWPSFPPHGLTPYGYSVGAAYVF